MIAAVIDRRSLGIAVVHVAAKAAWKDGIATLHRATAWVLNAVTAYRARVADDSSTAARFCHRLTNE